MADDDDRPKKQTLESLFHVYSNYRTYTVDIDNEYYDSILLSQIDYWLEQANLLKTVFTMTETGLVYMKFKKWRLDFEEFLDFLNQICAGKEISISEVKEYLLQAGVPGGAEADIVDYIHVLN